MVFNFDLTRGKFAPSFSHQYHITFHFKFELKISEFIVNRGYETLTRQVHETIDESARIVLKIHPDKPTKETAQLFANDTSEAITTILACLPIRVSDYERQQLIAFAIREGNRAVINSMCESYEDVDLYILVRKEDRQVLDLFDEASEYSCMVPASDSLVLLKRFDGEMIRTSDHENCCICYEELVSVGEGGDVTLLSMPCEHVFHGHCIKKWLSTSHYCPLCRFEMPRDTK